MLAYETLLCKWLGSLQSGSKDQEEELQRGNAIREFTLLSICLNNQSLSFISFVHWLPALAFPAFWSVFCDMFWVVLSPWVWINSSHFGWNRNLHHDLYWEMIGKVCGRWIKDQALVLYQKTIHWICWLISHNPVCINDCTAWNQNISKADGTCWSYSAADILENSLWWKSG